tara:strand:- start:5806 stop:5946 length:141 start_codon:yes stop_codon:yes gene_type:complete
VEEEEEEEEWDVEHVKDARVENQEKWEVKVIHTQAKQQHAVARKEV